MHKIKRKVGPVMIIVAAFSAASSPAEPPDNVVPTPRERVEELDSMPWIEVIEKEIPPLKNKLGNRWPMIAWHSVGMEPLAKEQIHMLLDRGLTQHLRMDENMSAAAKALQEAGSPVIFMQGQAGSWPYSLAADSSRWGCPCRGCSPVWAKIRSTPVVASSPVAVSTQWSVGVSMM